MLSPWERTKINRPVVFEKNASYDAPLSGYLTAKYDNQWWLGYIIEAFDYTQEVKLRFLHPAGPSASIFYPNLEDSCIIHKSDLLLSVKPKTITWKRYQLSQKEIQATEAKLL